MLFFLSLPGNRLLAQNADAFNKTAAVGMFSPFFLIAQCFQNVKIGQLLFYNLSNEVTARGPNEKKKNSNKDNRGWVEIKKWSC